jgi:Universal stress protein family
MGVTTNEFTDAAASVKELLDAAVSKATESDPDSATDPVRVTQETVEGHAAQVLLESVSGYDLMVVGSHGHGGFVGAMLGSVGHHVVSHEATARAMVQELPARQIRTEGVLPTTTKRRHKFGPRTSDTLVLAQVEC